MCIRGSYKHMLNPIQRPQAPILHINDGTIRQNSHFDKSAVLNGTKTAAVECPQKKRLVVEHHKKIKARVVEHPIIDATST